MITWNPPSSKNAININIPYRANLLYTYTARGDFNRAYTKREPSNGGIGIRLNKARIILIIIANNTKSLRSGSLPRRKR